MKRYLMLLCVLMFALTFISCGEYASDEKPVRYPDSVYGKAKFGYDKFN